MEIKKSTIECYKLRSKTSSVWADITLDSLDRAGRLQIASDYGNWQYYWGSCGESFKKFLTGLDIGYVANKFGENRYFDLNATLKNLKDCIISENFPEINADDYDLTDEEEKASFEDEKLSRQSKIDEFNNDFERLSNAYDENDFVHIWYQCDNIIELVERPDIVHCISPLFLRFWNEIWPFFINELKKENEKDTVVAEN